MSSDTYNDERLFLRVVELGSMRAVARETGHEPSSISRRISGLEKRLGTELVQRGSGRTRPTSAGERYYSKMRDLLAQIDAVEAEVSGEIDRPSGLLRVTATIDFGQHHVAQWLLDFKRQHEAVNVELTLSSRNVDLVTAGIDVGIRVGRQPDSSLIQTKLADVPRVLVASPCYLEQSGTPKLPDDLGNHDHVFFLPENRQSPLELIDYEGTTHRVYRSGGVTLNAVHSVVEAVKQGFGIHVGPRWAFHHALETGEVVEVLPEYATSSFPMLAIRAPAVLMPARIQSFIEFARERVREIPGLIAP